MATDDKTIIANQAQELARQAQEIAALKIKNRVSDTMHCIATGEVGGQVQAIERKITELAEALEKWRSRALEAEAALQTGLANAPKKEANAYRKLKHHMDSLPSDVSYPVYLVAMVAMVEAQVRGAALDKYGQAVIDAGRTKNPNEIVDAIFRQGMLTGGHELGVALISSLRRLDDQYVTCFSILQDLQDHNKTTMASVQNLKIEWVKEKIAKPIGYSIGTHEPLLDLINHGWAYKSSKLSKAGYARREALSASYVAKAARCLKKITDYASLTLDDMATLLAGEEIVSE